MITYVTDPTANITYEQWDDFLKWPYPGLPACCGDMTVLRDKIKDLKEVGWTYFTAEAFLDALEDVKRYHDMSFSELLSYLETHARTEVALPTEVWYG